MLKVWVVSECIPFESPQVVSIHASEIQAIEAITKLGAATRRCSFEYTEYEVDPETPEPVS